MYDTTNGKCLRHISEHAGINAILSIKFTDDTKLAW